MEFGGLSGHIDDLFVRREHRRQGAASAGLDALVEECRRRGCRSLHVEADPNNDAANALYRRYGLVPGDDRRRALRIVWQDDPLAAERGTLAPPTPVTRTAVIVGAGIGGLSAGIALRQAGWNIRIFERAASPRELGFGLGLAPNAIAALRRTGRGRRGAGPRLRADGAANCAAWTARSSSARSSPPEALGGPMVMALRPALHGALLDAVGTDAIALGSDATGFTVAGDRVTLHMANGDVAEGDLLVGADGAGSVIRRALHPAEPPPRSSGIVAVRGAVHGALHHLGDLSAIYYLGPGVESMLVRASDTGIYWFLSLARELVPPACGIRPRSWRSCRPGSMRRFAR